MTEEMGFFDMINSLDLDECEQIPKAQAIPRQPQPQPIQRKQDKQIVKVSDLDAALDKLPLVQVDRTDAGAGKSWDDVMAAIRKAGHAHRAEWPAGAMIFFINEASGIMYRAGPLGDTRSHWLATDDDKAASDWVIGY